MYRLLCILLITFSISINSFASLKDDLFDDYKIYSGDVENVINKTKKKVFKNIDNIKKQLIDGDISQIENMLKEIHSDILFLDKYIKQSNEKFKTQNMKDALTYPYLELTFYEKVANEIVDFYKTNGSITKKDIKKIEHGYDKEKEMLKTKEAIIRKEFLSAVFD